MGVGVGDTNMVVRRFEPLSTDFFKNVCSLHFAKSFFLADPCHWKNFLMLKAVFPSNLSSALILHV